jgi:hypothetical protein
MKSRLSSKLAIGAIAAVFGAPAFAQQNNDGRFGWLTRWIPPHTNIMETVNGNDFRDNRDSTILRNDVPLDQTTLHEAGQGRSSDASTYHSQAANSGDMSASQSSAARADTDVLPATAVAEETTVVIEPAPMAAADHTPTTSGPAIAYAPAAGDNVAQTAQRNETLVAQPSDGSAMRQEGMATPSESEVTARNLRGVQPVRDGAQRDVYTGIEGAGGTTAGREGEEVMGQ